MEDKHIAILATDLVYEILFNLDEKYRMDTNSTKSDILKKMIDAGTIKSRMVGILTKDIENVVIWLESQLYRIASGQQRLDGERFVAGFKEKKENQ